MSTEVKKEDAPKEMGDRYCGYKLLKGMGQNSEGDVIHVPEAIGDALVAAGIAELWDGTEAAKEEEPQEEEAPMVANAVDKLTKKIEKEAAEAVAKKMTVKPSTPEVASVPAEVKTPVYKSEGAYIKGIIKTVLHPDDRTEKNKVMEYQKIAAKAWDRLGVQVKIPLGINETSSSQGGYLVNPQFSPDVYTIPHGQIDLQAQCRPVEAKSNVYNQRFVNESSLANGSIFGGLNMVATAEGASLISSMPAWNNVAFQLQKLAIFVYYTSEVLEDASYPIESELDEYVRKAFLYGINTQIVQGSTLEGALNAPSLITVTSSSNDTHFHSTPATALTYADLANIWAQVYPDCKASPKGMWLYHPSLETCLTQMTYTFSGGNPAWGIQYDAREGLGSTMKIFGKNAFACWACSAPGTAGDILYVDFDTFVLYRRPYRVEVSKDFQFGTDQVAVRFINRLDCKTVFRNTVTGVNGVEAFGPIVTRSSIGS